MGTKLLPVMYGGEDWPYTVSDEAVIRRTGRARGATPGKAIRSGGSSNSGYRWVSLHKNGEAKRGVYVHDVVAETFHGPKPEGAVVHHINSDKEDNRPANLVYSTPRDNALEAIKAGLDAQQFAAIRERLAQLADEFGITSWQLSRLANTNLTPEDFDGK